MEIFREFSCMRKNERHINCYATYELKTTDFKPEYAGKLNFYLAAVDRQLKHPSDNPSIGMIICRTKNDLKVEYSLEEARCRWEYQNMQ